MNATGIMVGAGVMSYVGSVRVFDGPFPPNTVKIVLGTAGLAILASLTEGTALREPTKWLAILFLLAATVRAVPAFQTKAKKGKTNG